MKLLLLHKETKEEIMSDDFNIDNDGSGFSVEDDEDLDQIMNAAAGASVDDEDTSKFFPTEERQPEARPIPSTSPISQVAENDFSVAELEEIISEETPVDNPALQGDPAVSVSQGTAPIIPEYSKPQVQDTPQELLQVTKIIKILDAYRKLNSEEKNISGQFITGGEVIAGEAAYIVKVMNVDPNLTLSMKTLSEAKSLDSVERAFYIMALDDETLTHLGTLVSVFSKGDLPSPSERIQYARILVHQIESLDAKSMSFVNATESVLSAAGSRF
jgi:hypothetical protein